MKSVELIKPFSPSLSNIRLGWKRTCLFSQIISDEENSFIAATPYQSSAVSVVIFDVKKRDGDGRTDVSRAVVDPCRHKGCDDVYAVDGEKYFSTTLGGSALRRRRVSVT